MPHMSEVSLYVKEIKFNWFPVVIHHLQNPTSSCYIINCLILSSLSNCHQMIETGKIMCLVCNPLVFSFLTSFKYWTWVIRSLSMDIFLYLLRFLIIEYLKTISWTRQLDFWSSNYIQTLFGCYCNYCTWLDVSVKLLTIIAILLFLGITNVSYD